MSPCSNLVSSWRLAARESGAVWSPKAPSAKNYLVEIQGYADPTGEFEKNLKLSRDRADAVVQYLTVKHHIPLRRIMVPMGYGETKLLDTSPTAAALAKNRRVEVRIMVNKGLGQQ